MSGKSPTAVSVRAQFKQEITVSAIARVISATHLVERVFWATLLLGCLFLTYRDCKPPIRSFLDEATVSDVELVQNQTIAFPGSTLCVNIPLALLNAKNVSRLSEKTMQQLFSDCLHSDVCVKRENFYDEFYDEIAATIKLISSYVVAEVGKKWQINSTNEIALEVPDSFYRFLLQTNLSVEQLVDRMTFAVCTKMAFVLESWHLLHKTSYDFCLSAAVTWFGVPPDTSTANELICFNVENFTRFSHAEGWNMLSFFPERFAIAVEPSRLETARAEGFFESYLNLASEAATTDISSSYVIIRTQECTIIEAAIAFRVLSLPKRRRPCSETETQIACRGNCRVASIRETCNCTAVSWLKALAYDKEFQPSCFSAYPLADFAKLAYSAKKVDTADACRRRCDVEGVSCEETLITFTTRPCTKEYRNGSSTIDLRVPRFSYISCVESLSMDLPALMSALGGVLGLWLETGFIGVIHLLAFPLLTAADRLLCRREKDHKSSDGKADGVDEAKDADDLKQRMTAMELRLQAVESVLAKSPATPQRDEVTAL